VADETMRLPALCKPIGGEERLHDEEMVLAILQRHYGLTIGDLARVLGRPDIGSVVRRLAMRGMVERLPSGKERRQVYRVAAGQGGSV
jgi:DNA-binding MarR family transcriptional regulator